MANRDILTIGTSAGGAEALLFLAGRFSADFRASIFVTIHLASEFRSGLDSILSRARPFAASFAHHGEAVRNSHICAL
jgi:chemotaxis response regulator CheB